MPRRLWLSGDARAFMHWARVAAEIAKISDSPMDLKVVRAIADDEERRAKQD